MTIPPPFYRLLVNDARTGADLWLHKGHESVHVGLTDRAQVEGLRDGLTEVLRRINAADPVEENQ